MFQNRHIPRRICRCYFLVFAQLRALYKSCTLIHVPRCNLLAKECKRSQVLLKTAPIIRVPQSSLDAHQQANECPWKTTATPPPPISLPHRVKEKLAHFCAFPRGKTAAPNVEIFCYGKATTFPSLSHKKVVAQACSKHGDSIYEKEKKFNSIQGVPHEILVVGNAFH